MSGRHLTVVAAALLGTALTPLPAYAQNGTWNGPGVDFNAGGNWTPAGVPTNRATLAAAGPNTVVVTASTSINAIDFAAGAQQYTLINSQTLTINGIGSAGITNLGAQAQTAENQGTMIFNNNATVVGGAGGIYLMNDSPVPNSHSITFNDTSGVDSRVAILSTGGSTSGVGNTAAPAGTATVTFTDSTHADGATITSAGGGGGGQGGVGIGGSATGGTATLVFDTNAHADGATIISQGGQAIGQGGIGAAAFGSGTGGTATVTFTNNAHADNAIFANSDGTVNALGGSEGAGGIANGGTATISFADATHADHASFQNFGLGVSSNGAGGSAGTPGGTGLPGGTAVATGGTVTLSFAGTSHADNATIANSGGTISASGGNGGAGDTGAGGFGGLASSNGGIVSLTFTDSSHANGATITNIGSLALAVGGVGGHGGSTGAGGDAGAAIAGGGGLVVDFSGSAQASGGTITNSAGDAVALGGNGGAGGSGAAGGFGGSAVANGAGILMQFSGTSTAGAGTMIVNQGGDATATAGNGGIGGSGAAGTGGLGGIASATGGNAQIVFLGNASAGSATIVNTAGTATAVTGNGGNGAVGNGGEGGFASARGGDATITFSGHSTAGSATIQNNAGATIGLVPGTSGSAGGGGGQGGPSGQGGVVSAMAIITFEDTAAGGSAHIENNGGQVVFNDASTFGTAAGAQILNRQFGFVEFNDTTSLGSASITNGGTSSGVTSFHDNATAGSGTLTNLAGGGTFFQGSSTAGSATISNQAGGVLTFANNSTGGTAVITNAGTMGVQDDADLVFARIIGQSGGTVSIASINGTLRLGSLSGTGNFTLGANALQVGYLNLNETYAGVISGTGQLIKRGTGTFVLTGASTYTGTTTITAGTLQVDGSITSSTVIVSGATLRGIGTITGNITNNGIFNAGNAANPTGTLHVTGNYQGNANSLFLVNIAGAASNLLQATGSLTLGGSTVRPQAAPGTFFLMQNDYRIAVGGSRNDTFAGLDESLLPSFIDASLFYTSTEAFLRLRRNATTFAQTAGLTPNQNAVSTSLDAAVAANNPLVFTTYLGTYNTLLGLGTTGPLQGALNALSGDALTAVPVAAQGQASRFAQRLDTYTWSNSSNLWGLIAYGDQEADGDGNGPGFDANGLEFQIGFNTSLGPNTRLGLSAGLARGDVDIDDRLASADVDTWSLGLQLRQDFGPAYVSGQLTYNWHSIDSSRALLLGGVGAADYDARTWTAAGELGAVLHSGSLMIEPHVSIRHADTDQDAYSESGPVGVLDVAATDYRTTRLGIGLRLANRDPAAPVRFHALARYEREMGDEQAALDNALPGLPTFHVLGTRLGDDILSGEAGVEIRVSGGVSLFAAAGGHTRSNETSLNANGGLRIVF